MDGRPVPGLYHILIQGIDEGGEKSVIVDYEILAGTVPGQEGKTGREYLSKSPKAMKRIVLFALAAGVTTMDELIKAKQAKVNPKINLQAAVNRQICIELYKNGQYTNITFEGFWNPTDEKAKDIPKNSGMLATVGAAAEDPLAGVNF